MAKRRNKERKIRTSRDLTAPEREILKRVERWQKNPVEYVREVIGADPTNQQVDALRALGSLVWAKKESWATGEKSELSMKRGISIMSGKGTGKDAFVSWCILWFLTLFDSKVPCTAPISRQLKAVLWAEITKWYNMRDSQGQYKYKLRDYLEMQSQFIYYKEPSINKLYKERFASQHTAAKNSNEEQQKETLSGLHADHMMIICDEASGIPDPVFHPLETTMTGECNFALLIFNPTRSSGFAYNSHTKHRDQWVCLHWNAEESSRVSAESIQMLEDKYGRDSNAYRVNVLGMPPEAGDDVLIPYDWVYDAQDRDFEVTDEPIVLGCDIARHGGDKSVICVRQGPKILELKSFTKLDTLEVAGWIVNTEQEYGASAIYLDAIGVGWGVYDQLKQFTRKAHPVDVSKKSRMDKCERIRDELWWKLRKRFEERTIAIPSNDELFNELTCIKYEVGVNGKVKIEPKYKLRKREGSNSSPDFADALCLTFYMDDTHMGKRAVDPYRMEFRLVDKTFENQRPKHDSWMLA